MCRFVLYHGTPTTLASLITEPAHSIIRQSFHAAETEEPLNGDGFGVAWYVPELSDRPGLFRSVSPAWSNQNLLDMARVTRSGCVMAHVRAATSGLVVAEPNCHPFTCGQYAFMHNGDVARFHQVKRRILADLSNDAFEAIKGSTDSEHLFGVFLDEVRDTDPASAPDRAAVLARALERAIHRVVAIVQEAKAHLPRPPHIKADEDECYINCAVSDGVCAVACRFTTDKDEPSSLYVHETWTAAPGASSGTPSRATMVASEPLGNDPRWHKVPKNHLVIIRADHRAEVRPIAWATGMHAAA